ncbi:MAG: rhamnogalacturonan acetylesterase, partial [Proteiniphilum sp.]|nr:rhamnogalacturonan acetylesterase [Proteiniphilum sp.]
MNRKATFWRLLLFSLWVITTAEAKAGDCKFYFGEGNKEGYRTVNRSTLYGNGSPYGYDLIGTPEGEGKPFFFSVDLPEGNYRVTVLLGDPHRDTHTTIRSESRRLMLTNVETRAGETTTRS